MGQTVKHMYYKRANILEASECHRFISAALKPMTRSLRVKLITQDFFENMLRCKLLKPRLKVLNHFASLPDHPVHSLEINILTLSYFRYEFSSV